MLVTVTTILTKLYIGVAVYIATTVCVNPLGAIIIRYPLPFNFIGETIRYRIRYIIEINRALNNIDLSDRILLIINIPNDKNINVLMKNVSVPRL